jgi:spermidine/putrescine transport system permease protein
MASLLQIYGRTLTAVFWLLAGLWVLGLIVLPQLMMVERSLWSLEKSEEAAQVTLDIDRLYNEVTVLQMDLAVAGEAQRPGLEARLAAARTEIARLEAVETAPQRVYGLQNYTRMSGLHLRVFVRTILYAALVTALALVVCYPLAYIVARTRSPERAALLFLGLVVPYAINELLRVYAWLMILYYQGVLNSLLDWLGLIDLASRGWIPFLEHPGSVFAAMVYAYVLFMVLPIYNAVQTLDPNQIEAACDLGASTWRIHRRVVIPHAKPGIAVGCIMTFMLSAGSFAVPQIMTRGLGGDWFSQLIYRQFFEANNWNIGAAYALSLLLACILFIVVVMRLAGVGVRDIAR